MSVLTKFNFSFFLIPREVINPSDPNKIMNGQAPFQNYDYYK